MNKIILSVLLVLLLSITVGCIRIVMPYGHSVTERSLEGDQFTKYDVDKDGQDDRYVYKFATEEIASDVFLDRTLEYNKSGTGYQGKIVLQFDDKSNGKTDYIHIEKIPKEFAANVGELEFSVPPDEIINPASAGVWKKQATEASSVSLVAIKRVFADDLANTEEDLDKLKLVWRKWAIENTADNLISITKAFEKADPAVLMKGMVATVVSYNSQKVIGLKSGPERDTYILQESSTYRGMCSSPLCRDDPIWFAWCGKCSQPYIQAACLAILSGDPSKWCVREGLVKNESDKDMCKGIYIQHECEEISDKAAKEKCYFTKAIELNCEIACGQITDGDNRNLCLAGVTNDAEYCEKIQDPETKDKCLEALGIAPEQKEPEQESQKYREQTEMEYWQGACDRGAGGGMSLDGGKRCYKCINGKAVQVPCN